MCFADARRAFLALGLGLTFVLLGACQSTTDSDMKEKKTARERYPHTFSSPDSCRVTHAELDWTIDFEKKTLSGFVVWTFERKAAPDEPLILDTRGLTIRSVSFKAGGAQLPASWELGSPDPVRGRPLIIRAPRGVQRVKIDYVTTDESNGLQWLAPEQTAGGKKPYLYSQAQAILARSFYPCQDTPAVRFTYEATVRAPDGIRPVMSARNDSETAPWRFSMPQPIPSYLLAIAAGDLAFKSLGPRSGVWTEPALLDAAAHEFADTEKMITATEGLYGPYLWERYDILVLPPSFPFGGMENPRLTFATPTILAGDRSLVSLVAHELAHSWSGNLVTNANWSNLWLNEGFTVYLERRIQEVVYGAERAEMEAVLGRQDLQEDLDSMPAGDTVLEIPLEGRDPDDVFSNIPYEKGYLFLRLVQDTVGRERFDAFLHSWFAKNKFLSRTTSDLRAALRDELFRDDPEGFAALRFEEWTQQPGLPSNAPNPKSPRLDRLAQTAEAFVKGMPATELKTEGWTTQEWLYFLRRLPDDLPVEKVAALDRRFGLVATRNAEILSLFLQISIRAGYVHANGSLENFLMIVGRRKFLKPIYQTLIGVPGGKELALQIYRKARPRYHAISANTLDELLGYKP